MPIVLPTYLIYLFTFILALGIGLYLTPVVRKAALSLGIMAAPDGDLRTQSEPVPYLGGVAIYLALLLALAIAVDFNNVMLGLLLGSTIILMVGLIDDFGVMTAKVKLMGQFIAALAMIKGGIVMDLEIFKAIRWPLDMPLLSWALSALWLTGLANAINFLDIEDGLAGGVAASCCPALLVVALFNGNTSAALFTVALFGGCVAFLRYNAPFPKAKIYLGDAGSLMLGMALGSLAMIGSYTAKNDLAAFCPVIILGVPCFEIGVTMLARIRRGVPVWRGSPDHVAKRLQHAGLSKKATLLMHWGVSLLLGGLAVFIMNTDIQKALISVGILAVIALIAAVLIIRINVPWPTGDPGEEN